MWLQLAAHLRLTVDAVCTAELRLDAALNDGWLRVNTLELNALRSHAADTVAAVRWSDVLTGRTGRLLVELTAEFSLSSEDLAQPRRGHRPGRGGIHHTAGRTVLQRRREHRAQL